VLGFALAGLSTVFASAPLVFQTGPVAIGNAGAIALADFNGDGKTDVVHANGPTVVVRLGDGAGGLGAPIFTANLPAGGSAPVAAGDLNGDGIPDFAVGFGTGSPGQVAVFFSNGAGGFTAGPVLDVAAWPGSMAIGDLNGDAIADLVVGSNIGSSLSVVLGTGGGAFATASFHDAGSTSRSVAIGDFNHDGKPDIASAGGEIHVLLGDGSGAFAPATQYPAGSFPVSLAVADIDGDGHLDLAVANDGTAGVSLLFGDGLGAFSEPVPVAVAQYPVSVLLRDLNGDGKPDLVVSTQFNGGVGTNAVHLLRNLGARAFELQAPFFVPAQEHIAPPHLAAGEMNGDRRTDLVIGDITSGPPADGDRTRVFLSSTTYPPRRADFDADRRSDILWRNRVLGENYAYLMDGKNIAGEGYLRTVVDQAWQIAAVGDFDGDRKSDILWRNSSTGENYIYLMNGTEIAAEGYLRTVADQAWQIAGVGDFDGDGKSDIVWRNSITGENYIYLMNGTEIAGEGYVRTVTDQAWRIAGVGDFDGDEKSDIVWRHSITGENYIYLMNGTAIAGEGYVRTVADQAWRIAGIGDFDGDGKGDLLWRNSSSGENYVYFMHGAAIKPGEGYVRTVADPSWKIVATGDYDGDGKYDIFWRHAATGENYFYPMDGTTIKPTEGYIRTVADLTWRPMPAVPLAFQTTFDCPEWKQSDGLSEGDTCRIGDGIAGSGGWVTDPNLSEDQITSAANHPGGGGGKGFRHWVGDGENNGGGGIFVFWGGVSEIWIRYYIRFAPGFAWGNQFPNMKTIYCNYSKPGTFYFGLLDGVIGGHVESDNLEDPPQSNHLSTVTWAQWQGGSTGSGNFHVLEVHAKMNTKVPPPGELSDGIFEFWLDGTKLYSSSKVHFSYEIGATFTDCKVGENHFEPFNNGADVYVDFDDIAVSGAGYIGPLNP
jgi:hypothetical protein